MKSKTVYTCETCGETWNIMDRIGYCLGCSEELCEHCMMDYSHCMKCAEGLTEEERMAKFFEEILERKPEDDEESYV